MRLLLICAAFGFLSFSAPRLVKTKVTDDITVSLPQEFFPMTDEDIAMRYPSVRQPLGAYTNQDRLVDFSVKISATQWPDTDIEMASKFFKAGIYNLYDKVEMINEGIVEVRKKRFISFEFTSRINGDRYTLGEKDPILKYTNIFYLVEPGRTLVFSFNCPKSDLEEWQETSQEIMESIRVK